METAADGKDDSGTAASGTEEQSQQEPQERDTAKPWWPYLLAVNLVLGLPIVTAYLLFQVGRVPPDHLICTIGDRFDPTSFVFPPDGLCSIVFFDSLYKPGKSTPSPPFAKHFQFFLDTAAEHILSEYGIGIDYKQSQNKSFVTEPATKSRFDSLWMSRIFHYGHVNTPQFGTNENDHVALIKSILRIAALMNDKKDITWRPVFTAVLLPIRTVTSAQHILKELRNAPVDILIGLAHQVDEDKRNPNCLMMPPSFIESPSPHYPYSLRLWHDVFEVLSKAQLQTTPALSVGLAFRRYKPRYPDPYVEGDDQAGNYSLMHPCTTFDEPQLLESIKVCKKKNWVKPYYHNETMSEFSFNKKDGWLFTHDGTIALRSKLCGIRKKYLSMRYAIAAMGIEYVDVHHSCHQEKYYKLNFLKKLVAFLDRDYLSADDLGYCLATQATHSCPGNETLEHCRRS